MKPEDRLNDQFEQAWRGTEGNGQHPDGLPPPGREGEQDPEVAELFALARRLYQAPQLQVTPDFARQLERRVVRHHIGRQLQRGSKRHSFFSRLYARPILSAALGLCVLFCLLGSTALALATRVNDPTNALYGLKLWEQHVQQHLSSSPENQATLDLQFARDRLQTLSSLADAAHAGAYHQALLDLDQQVDAATTAINSLPAGTQHTQLAGELASLKLDARHVLHGLLAQLALPERLATTDELGRLGDATTRLRQATLILPTHPNSHAIISFAGLNLQPGAQLLVDGKVIAGTGMLQNGLLLFVIDWRGMQHPHSLGLLNPDDTAAETLAINIKGTPGGNQNDHGKKPPVTPTPHGNRPPVTPTPHSNRPSATSAPRH